MPAVDEVLKIKTEPEQSAQQKLEPGAVNSATTAPTVISIASSVSSHNSERFAHTKTIAAIDVVAPKTRKTRRCAGQENEIIQLPTMAIKIKREPDATVQDVVVGRVTRSALRKLTVPTEANVTNAAPTGRSIRTSGSTYHSQRFAHTKKENKTDTKKQNALIKKKGKKE